MIVSRCEKALRSGARPELLQTGPCSSRLGWGFFKFLNLDNRMNLESFLYEHTRPDNIFACISAFRPL